MTKRRHVHGGPDDQSMLGISPVPTSPCATHCDVETTPQDVNARSEEIRSRSRSIRIQSAWLMISRLNNAERRIATRCLCSSWA